MTRAVLDTNILISACWKPGGLEDRVVELGLAGRFQMLASEAVWAEYVEVLGRKKFASVIKRIEPLIARLEHSVERIEVNLTIEEASDPDDNRMLECAAAGHAAYLVTGNLKDYPPEWKLARIVNARQFLEAMSWI